MFKRGYGQVKKLLTLAGLLLLSIQVNAIVMVVETPLGDFQIDLLEDEAPNTVNNFISYINDGSFENSFVHRSSTGFVIQAGSYTLVDETLEEIEKKDPVVNEFGRSNIRGTVSMAKVGGDPNSATSSWFINVADNSENLDNQNGGFTVFGVVLGDGMDIVDEIHALSLFDASETSGADFTELPLIDYSGTGVITAEHLVFTQISLPDDLNEITDLAITKSVNITAPAPNNSVEFTVTVSNDGTDDANSIEITDPLPEGMEVPTGMAPFTSLGSYDTDTGVWSIDTLSAGSNATLNLPAIPQQFADPECFVNTAALSDFAGVDTNFDNNSANSTVYVGGISTCSNLRLSVSTDTFFEARCSTSFSDAFDFFVEVTNDGPDTAENVVVTISGSLDSTAQDDIVIDFGEILADASKSQLRSWTLACNRPDSVATYSVVTTSDSNVSTGSVLSVTGEDDVPDNPPTDDTSDNPTPDNNNNGGGGGLCFIATAAYGSYMHPHVKELRDFRDDVLLHTEIGRRFVALYYQYSPPVADIIADNVVLKSITRILLTPVVYAVIYPLAASFIILLLMGALVFRHTRKAR